MKKAQHRAPIVGLAGLMVLLVAMVASSEALAQGGRAGKGRSGSNVRIERQEGGNRKAKVSRRAEGRTERITRTVQKRSKKRTGTVSRRSDGSGRSRAVVASRGKAERVRSQGGERNATRRRTLAPRSSDRSTGRSGGVVDSRQPDRRTGSRQVRRDKNRSGRAAGTTAGSRKNTRVERDGHRDRRTKAVRDRNRRPRQRDGNRSRYVGPKVRGTKSIRYLYDLHDRHYFHKRRHLKRYAWCTAYHHPGHHHYIDAHINIGSHVYLGFAWPWEIRYRRHWSPRFRYRQVVLVETGWRGNRRRNRVEVQTYYRHRVLFADQDYSEVEIEIDAIDFYQNGRFLSTVDRIPGSLRKVRAIVYADGRIEFDRNLFLMGDASTGFEIIATKYYTDHLFSAYRRGHGFKVGRVSLQRGRVKKVRHSRFFDGGHFVGYAPISLLPDDDRLWDYGRPVSDRYYDSQSDRGWYRDYRGQDWNGGYDDSGYELSRSFQDSYGTPDGGTVRLERATALDRLD